jgi:putative lipoic acid-binding regulatory protein
LRFGLKSYTLSSGKSTLDYPRHGQQYIGIMDPDDIAGRPLIEYPCRWEYKAIGLDEALMRAAIAEIMADLEHELSFSRNSSGGRYCSMLLVVAVDSEDHRDSIFTALQGHRDIRMVL